MSREDEQVVTVEPLGNKVAISLTSKEGLEHLLFSPEDAVQLSRQIFATATSVSQGGEGSPKKIG